MSVRERRTRHLRACRGEEKEKEVLASGKREGGREGREVANVCSHAFRVRIARERGTGREGEEVWRVHAQ